MAVVGRGTTRFVAGQSQMLQTACTPALWFSLLALQFSACSALIDVSGRQCETDVQCRDRQLGDVCSDHVCIAAPAQTSSGIQESARRNDRCVKDTDCSGDTPRCMRNACVSQAVAELFLCHQEDAAIDATPVKYSFRVIEYVTRMPPANITAWACRGNDVKCTAAIQPVRISQDTGSVEFELPRGFLGFFEVHSAAIPALSYLTKPILVNTVDRDLQLSSPETFMTLAMLDGAEVDDSKGMALLEAFDCTGTPVGGVHFESSVGGVSPFYIVDNVPNKDVSVSSLDTVHNVADGGFLNVEPGFVTFTARYGVGGSVLGAFNVAVRVGTFTFVDMYF
jgi:hypothetical protein